MIEARTRSFLALMLGSLLLIPVGSLILKPQLAHAHGSHPDAATPGSDKAFVFSPFGWASADDQAAMKYFENKVKAQGYTVTKYIDTTEASDNNPRGATAANFKLLSGAGLVLIVSHGAKDPNLLMVEGYKTAAARNTAFDNYLAAGGGFLAAELAKCDAGDHLGNIQFGICVTEDGVKNHFTDSNSVVHGAFCFSSQFVEEFDSTEYFGYSIASVCPQIKDDVMKLWGRMHGTTDGGRHRSAQAAFQAGGFTAGFVWSHKGELQTVLSPSVKKVVGSPIFGTIIGNIYFDVKMDRTINWMEVLGGAGCNGEFIAGRWASAKRIEFSYQPYFYGPSADFDATFTVNATKAIANDNFKNLLDGNQDPVGKTHVGPNGDNHVFKIPCA